MSDPIKNDHEANDNTRNYRLRADSVDFNEVRARLAREIEVSENRTELTELEITPNVVIPDPDRRRKLGVTLYIILAVIGVATLFFAFFPELAFGTDLPTRIILFAGSACNLIAASFGLIITTPNVPSARKI